MISSKKPADPYVGVKKELFIELLSYLRSDDNDGTLTKSEFCDYLGMRYLDVVIKKNIDYFYSLHVIVPTGEIRDGEVVYREAEHPSLKRINDRELSECLD